MELIISFGPNMVWKEEKMESIYYCIIKSYRFSRIFIDVDQIIEENLDY